MTRSAFIGRWQTLKPHKGHTWLIDQALKEGKPVLILVRDVKKDSNNPYHPLAIVGLLQDFYDGEDVIVQLIPDIGSINYGRDVGYEVIEHKPPPHIHSVSATQERSKCL